MRDLTGMPHVLPTHQGRAGERILYGHLGGKGKVFISNTHFDTTRANIEFTGATAIDIPIPEGQDTALEHPFKGNMDVQELERLLNEHKGHVGAVILTVTNNSGGGQPVSLANAEEVSATCKRHGVPMMLDCCRVAENSWFVKNREQGMGDMTYRSIAQRMFALADGAVMSAKKDAFANIGGFIAFRDAELAKACTQLLIITEGVYLGRRAVVWMYDLTARKYDGIKQYDVYAEELFVVRPLLHHLRAIPAPRILDVATGTGRLPWFVLQQPTFQGRVTGLDASANMLARRRPSGFGNSIRSFPVRVIISTSG